MIRQARDRFIGPDEYTIEVKFRNDQRLYFQVRKSLIDATLIPVTNEKVVFIATSKAGKSTSVSATLENEDGLHLVRIPFAQIEHGMAWQLDRIDEGGFRITHATGTFSVPK